VGIGGAWVWQRRDRLAARSVGALAVALTAWWAYVLLDRTPAWHPWLRSAVLVVGFVAAAGFVLPRAGGRLRVAVAAVAVCAALAAPAAYSLDTASNAHTGALPSAG